MFNFYTFIRQALNNIMTSHSYDLAFETLPFANLPNNFDNSTPPSQFMPKYTDPVNERHIEVFLIYVAYHQRRRSDFNQFFQNPILDLVSCVFERPIFLQEEKALKYMQFIDSDHCIFHAYVPESAIEGHFDQLQIKKGILSKNHIHGCYPSYAKGQEYIVNNTFDKALLDLAIRSKEDVKFT